MDYVDVDEVFYDGFKGDVERFRRFYDVTPLSSVSNDDAAGGDGNNTAPIEKAVISKVKDSVYIVGTEVQYVETEVKEGFEFGNPKSKGECGCGESFNF